MGRISPWGRLSPALPIRYFASGAAATVTDTIPRLLGRPAISFEQFAKDHRTAFLP